MSTWALNSPAMGGGIEKKPSVELQSPIQCAISSFLCDVFESGSAALNDLP